MGVGFATEEVVHSIEQSKQGRPASKSSLAIRYLDENGFPPDEIRLIARKQQGHDTPDLSTSAYELYELLKEQCTQ